MLPQIQGAESREFIRFASIRQSRGSSWNFGARNSFRLTARSPDSGKSSQSLTIRQGQTEVEWRLDSGSIFTGFGAGAQAAVSVRDFAKLFPLTVQSRIGFEPPFDCPRFVPSRSIGYFVGRQDA